MAKLSFRKVLIHSLVVGLLIVSGVALKEKTVVISAVAQVAPFFKELLRDKDEGKALYSVGKQASPSKPQKNMYRGNAPSLKILRRQVHFPTAKNECWESCLNTNSAQGCDEDSIEMRNCIKRVIERKNEVRWSRGEFLPR